ncbi:MAG: metal ABC transporter permease [Candidatus Nitrohelix vancouverensis]|uniref:Metal ABC transporter permease n=1 Tax=Candidatus Nitrohelix vancouverensis TaxID=2705534 RepID=A0A7T0C436_9BACT|nr:MAG: metal ABC transporter permease [Candidatus Nitrohelix vancouverensis]
MESLQTAMSFLAAPALACIALSTTFAWFGLHVLKREILFVDLSLAQLAALGATLALALGAEHDSLGSTLISLALVVFGSFLFAWLRMHSRQVSQEAVIGVIYVVAASLSVLLADGLPHGAEHLHSLLNGSVLWISWAVAGQIAVVAGLVLSLHWKFRDRIMSQTQKGQTSLEAPLAFSWWDVFFFSSLGIMVVLATPVAGVFLVFALLIIPAVCATLLTSGRQYMLGALLGAGACLFGLAMSYAMDLPAGGSIVCVLGLLFFASLTLSLSRR